VKARLIAGGIANMQTCVQVKRMKSVGRSIVQSLRGSLSSHKAGLLITSGLFTEGAAEEAKDPHKVPVALLDCPAFVELPLDHEIGVEHVNVTLHRLSLDNLSKEKLEALVEDSDNNDNTELLPSQSSETPSPASTSCVPAQEQVGRWIP
jgi:Restriction endonuclease